MKELDNISIVYFLGIGGIGMSALARYFRYKGKQVSGYDKTETSLTRSLTAEGIAIHYTDDISLADKQADIVIYTPAIPKEHTELQYFREKEYTLLKRSEVLGMITHDGFNICVAGTHGKTTTSAMIAHILRDSDYGCTAFLGGISVNYNTNFWSSGNEVSVVEADEYDRSFLKLYPDIAVITSMDADHLDIYGSENNMQDAFIQFSANIRKDGLLLKKFNISRSDEFHGSRQLTYSLSDKGADVYAENISIKNATYHFDVVIKDQQIKGFELNMGGSHNIENAVAAITVAYQLTIKEDAIKKAIAGFTGVKRRFEYIIKEKDHVMIDDYAHHPEELRALIMSAKELYPDWKCTVVFQPHLYTRTRDLASGFAQVLDMADEVILLPIYPARELPVEGVSSGMVVNMMHSAAKSLLSKEALLEKIKREKPVLLITAGAGDIDMLVEPLKNVLN